MWRIPKLIGWCLELPCIMIENAQLWKRRIWDFIPSHVISVYSFCSTTKPKFFFPSYRSKKENEKKKKNLFCNNKKKKKRKITYFWPSNLHYAQVMVSSCSRALESLYIVFRYWVSFSSPCNKLGITEKKRQKKKKKKPFHCPPKSQQSTLLWASLPELSSYSWTCFCLICGTKLESSST